MSPPTDQTKHHALEILDRFIAAGSNVRANSGTPRIFLVALEFRSPSEFVPAMKYLLEARAVAVIPDSGGFVLAPVRGRFDEVYLELKSAASSAQATLAELAVQLSEIHLSLVMGSSDSVQPDVVDRVLTIIRLAISAIQKTS